MSHINLFGLNFFLWLRNGTASLFLSTCFACAMLTGYFSGPGRAVGAVGYVSVCVCV